MERTVKVTWATLETLLKQSKLLAPSETIKNITLTHPKEIQIATDK